jgi:Flp pilus assembly protein TadG
MRIKQSPCSNRAVRMGAAAVELAFLAPLLSFMFIIAIDWARVFYYSVTINDCARNGALYLSDDTNAKTSPHPNYEAAALAGTALLPKPVVSSASGSDTNGPWVECTVTYQFNTITNFPGVPSTTKLQKTVRMHKAVFLPK